MKRVSKIMLVSLKIRMQKIELYHLPKKKHYQNKEKAVTLSLLQNKETNKMHPLHYINSRISTLGEILHCAGNTAEYIKCSNIIS